MSALGDRLRELKELGLLDRAIRVRVGHSEVLLSGPPVVLPPEPEPLTAAQQEAEYRDGLYAAARGGIPGVE